MHRVLIQNQENLPPFPVLDKPLQKSNEYWNLESAFKYLESKTSLIVNCRYHIARPAAPICRHDGWLSLWRPAYGRAVIAAHACLVPPKNAAIFTLRPSRNGGVLLGRPFRHCYVILLPRTTCSLLGREPPREE